MPYVIDMILSSGSLSIRRFCGGGGGEGGEQGPSKLFSPLLWKDIQAYH